MGRWANVLIDQQAMPVLIVAEHREGANRHLMTMVPKATDLGDVIDLLRFVLESLEQEQASVERESN